MDGTRLDKWLWAARFYKTRSLAKQAIDGGKVQVNGVRGKAARNLCCGDTVRVRTGSDERVVQVIALSDTRRGAKEAALLYQETAESLAERQRQAELRRASRSAVRYTEGRPDKRDRRELQRFRDRNSDA